MFGYTALENQHPVFKLDPLSLKTIGKQVQSLPAASQAPSTIHTDREIRVSAAQLEVGPASKATRLN